MRALTDYATLIFDCDGIILNSNRLKTEAFNAVSAPYGEVAADALVTYHTENGGVSRYRKFEWFFETVLGNRSDETAVNKIAGQFAGIIWEGLMTC